MIAATKKLCTVNTGACQCSEQSQIQYEHQLVYYGYAGHLFGTDLTDHDVIEQAYEI
jgi:hypothetical protein